MPRSPRIEYEGALYHVLCRGDRREPIFRDDRDRRNFLETLEEACERSGAFVCSYVLMDNHYHLLLETPLGNLVATMTWFQSTVTARFNARHRVRGHLFQGRYKAIPVESESREYARTVSDYIHLNPARAGIVNKEKSVLKNYRWSSFPILCSGERTPKWLHGGRVFEWHRWNAARSRDRLAYERYLEGRARECWQDRNEADEPEEWQAIRRGWYFGSGEFRETLEELAGKAVEGLRRESFTGEALRKRDAAEALRVLNAGLKSLGMGRDEMRSLRKNDPRKQGLSWLVKTRTGIPDAWICEALDMGDRSNISRAVSAYRQEKTKEIRTWKHVLHVCTD